MKPRTGPVPGGQLPKWEQDLCTWDFWWEFNKDPYLRLKEAVQRGPSLPGGVEGHLNATRSAAARDTPAPTDEQVFTQALPALKAAIDQSEQRDMVSAVMMAMAKIGRNGADFRLRDVFLQRLRARDLEIQETAALAIGIAALDVPESLQTLTDLAADTPAGRQLCGTPEVNDRTRTFATYGLGLLANRSRDPVVAIQILEVLTALLTDGESGSCNLRVAVVNAIGLLDILDHGHGANDPLLADAVAALTDYYRRDLGPRELQVQAHVPAAIARLLGPGDGTLAREAKRLFALDLAGKGGGACRSWDVRRSCALALGVLCKPCGNPKDGAEDNAFSELLLERRRGDSDSQLGGFCLIALAQIGGKENHDRLRAVFSDAQPADQPWCAIAMGVCAAREFRAAEAAGAAPAIAVDFGRPLQAALQDSRSPSTRGAIAVALGLCRYQQAADDLRALLRRSHDDEEQGYLCIGLALMGEVRAIVDIHEVADRSLRRPYLLRQAVVALGILGDKAAAGTLEQLLGNGDRNLFQLSAVAMALGSIGDARSIQPLTRMLSDQELTPLSRAFAAVALGCICDKGELPWNSRISCNLNYRAAVETLTGAGLGILDLL